jgi:hypothetical protein
MTAPDPATPEHSTGEPTATDARAAKRVPRWRAPLLMVLKILAVVIGVYLVVQALRAVDWAQVGDALGRLTWWELVVIVLIVCVRQTVNAGTLPVLISGLSLPHALSTALSGTLIQTFTPPPSDTVLRLAMLNSYGVENTRGAAGLVLDTAVFYLARFVAPIIGLGLTLVALSVESTHLWMALLGLGVTVLLLWALWMISKGETAASRVGTVAGGLIKRLRPSVDPQAWSAAVVRFQRVSAAGLASKIAKATPVMLLFILVDSLVVAFSLRFVGIPGADIGYLAVIGAMFTLYPLTVFPFAGLGVLDAALIVLINAEGVADGPDMVAALVIWRAATLGLPLIPGLIALTLWRSRGNRDSTRSVPADGGVDGAVDGTVDGAVEAAGDAGEPAT